MPDGTLTFDTNIDTSGFEAGIAKIKAAAAFDGSSMFAGLSAGLTVAAAQAALAAGSLQIAAVNLMGLSASSEAARGSLSGVGGAAAEAAAGAELLRGGLLRVGASAMEAGVQQQIFFRTIATGVVSACASIHLMGSTLQAVCAQMQGAAAAGGAGIGMNLGRGVVSGIAAASPAVQAAARTMVESAVAAAKAAGGIHSPSRVMRDEVGAMLVEGMYVGITSTIDKVPKAFEQALEEIKLQLDAGAINQAQYYQSLEELRDRFFAKGSDKWWKYTQEILAYEREDGFQDLERRLKKREIAEGDYYDALEGLRDKYYAQGTKEYEAYTDEIEKYRRGKTEEGIRAGTEAVERQFQQLRRLLELDIINEEQYYSRLGGLRDRYFLEGSQEWQDYTDDISDYHHDKMLKVFDDLANREKEIHSNLLKGLKVSTLSEHTTARPSGAPLLIAGRPYVGGAFGEPGERTEPVLELQNLKQYANNVKLYKEILIALQDRTQLPEGFFQELLDMGMEEGYALAKALTEMSDAALKEYLADWQAIQELTSGAALDLTREIAGELYGPEAKAQTEDAAQAMGGDFVAALKTYFGAVPEDFCDLGALSAQSFGAGFSGELETLFRELSGWMAMQMQAAAPLPAVRADQSGGETYSPVYNFYTSGETTRQQLAAARNADAVARLRGGYHV